MAPGLACVARGVGLGEAEGRSDAVGVTVGEGVDCVRAVESLVAGDGLTSSQAARATRKMAIRIQVEVRTRRSRRISRSPCRFCGFQVVGRLMPSRRSPAAIRNSSIRPTSNCLPGSVLATTRTWKWSTSMLCTPMTAGGSSSRSRISSSLYACSPISRSRSETRLTSTATGTGTSTTARAQSRDRLVTWVICPFGVMTTSPSAVRTVVTRRVTSSTVPTAGLGRLGTESWTRSPNPYWRSLMMKKPARMSCTTRWAPNPSATAATAAGATRLVSGTPRRLRTATPVAQ